MAVYSTFPVSTPTLFEPTDFAWHTVHPVLAATGKEQGAGGKEDGAVYLFSAEGDQLDEVALQRVSHPKCMAWHPTEQLLAVGFGNGEIVICNAVSGHIQDCKVRGFSATLDPPLPALSRLPSSSISTVVLASQPRPSTTMLVDVAFPSVLFLPAPPTSLGHQGAHAGAICSVTWSPSGDALVVTDSEGKIGVWKISKVALPKLTQEYKYKGEAVCCTFRQLPDSDPQAPLGERRPSPFLKLQRQPLHGSHPPASATGASHSPGLAAPAPSTAVRVYSTSRTSLPPPPNHHYVHRPLGTDMDTFYVGTTNNEVVQCSMGNVSSVVRMQKKIVSMLYDAYRDVLVTLTEDLILKQIQVSGAIQEHKLSGRRLLGAVWAGPSVLATACEDSNLRLWKLDDMDNYQLKNPSGQVFVQLHFDPVQKLLVATTASGGVVLWRHNGDASASDEENQWRSIPCSSADDGTHGVHLDVIAGGGKGFVAVRTTAMINIYREFNMLKASSKDTTVVQVSSKQAILEHDFKSSHDIELSFTIKGMCAGLNAVAFWSGKQVAIYQLVKEGTAIRQIGDFGCETMAASIFGEDTLYVGAGSKIKGFSFQGVESQEIRLAEQEGDVTSLNVNSKALVAGTSTCFIRLWDLSRREARQLAPPRMVSDDVDAIVDVRVNADGTRVSFLGLISGIPDTNVWVWNVENDTINSYDFGTKACTPVSHFWDSTEPKLFSVEALPTGSSPDLKKEVVSCFSTADDGIFVQHEYKLDRNDASLMGMDVPNMYYSKINDTISGYGRATDVRVMPDFAGLDRTDADTKNSMMSFSFNLTIGNMDEAFKAVRLIQNDAVWENMARMCVSSRRMDVAPFCLGKMGHVYGARAMREAEQYPEAEARLACLATQLGMNDDAESLYKECERWDLLNKFYQASGRWTEAIDTAQLHDRSHLRNTFYAYAKYLESSKKTKEAIEYYERSETQRFEVPRMLGDDPQELEAYVKNSQDKELLKWWAQFLESSSDLESALSYYDAAGDILSQTRVRCYRGEIDTARELVEQTQDRAAAYHLARQFEARQNGEEDEAIKYFSMSGCYSNAIRLAKELGQGNEVFSLALRSTKRDMIEAAKFYEEQSGMEDKAVTLYHKGGHVAKALELCFQFSLYQSLAEISSDLDQNADPELLQRAAEFFLSNSQFDKATNLLIAAQQFDEALNLCEQRGVTITDEMAEKMTIEKGDDNARRNKVLERIADMAADQGSFQLAAKKYTQAGNKVKAMRALLKCGDAAKIMFFASKCRSKEIFIMAANFLQTLDWRHDHEIMENIKLFYTKGKALDKLSSFYDSCAQVEIDDYQNYDKALGALTEALKYINKAKNMDFDEQEARVNSLTNRIDLVKKFVSVKQLAKSDTNGMVEGAHALLRTPEIETAVRIGDIYGFLFQFFAESEQYHDAFDMMKEMLERIPNVNLAYYIDMGLVAKIRQKVNPGGDFPVDNHEGDGVTRGQQGQSLDDGDDIADEVEA